MSRDRVQLAGGLRPLTPPPERPAAPRGLSVLIVGYRRPDLLQTCLRSVAQHLPEATVRVWENSGDTDEQALRTAHPGVELEVSPVNIGFAAAVNRLAERSGDDDLLLLNPDAELLGPLTATRAALAEPGVAAVAPDSEDSAPQTESWDVAHRRLTLPRALVAHSGYAPRLRGRRISDRYLNRPDVADGYLAGACLLLSRDAWDAVGPFDEEFFLYGEESDWQQRARAAGWRLRLADEVGVRHTGHGTVAGDPAAATRSRDLLRANVALNLEHGAGVHRADAFLAGMAVLDRVQRSSRVARRTATRRTGKPDVVITVNRLVFGGAERQHVQLATELTERGYPVTIACLQRFGPLVAELPTSVRVVRTPWWAPAVDLGDGPAVVIGGDTNTEAGFATLWRRGRRQRRWLVGAHVPPAADGPTYSAGLARALRTADGFVALSPRHWQQVGEQQDLGRRWFAAPNGVVHDSAALDGVVNRPRDPARPLQLAMLARIVEHKNPHLLVAALDGLREHDWELSIFGDGPDRERLEALTPPELVSRVHWRGWSPGPDDALRDCDLLCVPSAAEAFPMVILEAMARAVPVIATSVCAVPDMLDGGRAGLLVEQPDVASWRAALARLLADPSGLPALGQAGLARMRTNYTIDAMADAYEAAFDDVLATAGR